MVDIVAVLGTRPEKIKLAPVLENLSQSTTALAIETGQHIELMHSLGNRSESVDSVPLGVSLDSLELSEKLGRMVQELAKKLSELQPRLVLVQGDTSSALAGAIAARFSDMAVAHVEAGLRTFDQSSPWPEEINRRLISQVATLHFAPTETSRQNLVREGIPEGDIHVTGNTAVDVVNDWAQALGIEPAPADKRGGSIVVTLHRRESHGTTRIQALETLKNFLDKHPDFHAKLFSHPNPAVLSDLRASAIGTHPNLSVLEPASHGELLQAISEASFIVSDSGGIQEEAPSLGRAVFIARDETERPEAVDQGRNFLCGAGLQHFEAKFAEWSSTASPPLNNPYGDGNAGARIARICQEFLQHVV